MTSPTLRIVGGGDPTDEELAALVAVIGVVRARGAAEGSASPASRWRRSARPLATQGGDGWLSAARRSSLRGGR